MEHSLTKENFWNDLKEKYPYGVQVFCDWIDEYKEKVKWSELFNDGSPHYAKMGWHNPKYHDLPMAMQIGIWIQFVAERGGCEYTIENLFSVNWEVEITGYLEMVNKEGE